MRKPHAALFGLPGRRVAISLGSRIDWSAAGLGGPLVSSEKARQKQVATRFKKGQSGNPAGKPKGTRNATTRMLEALLAGEAEEITRKAIEMAKAGDGPALRA